MCVYIYIYIYWPFFCNNTALSVMSQLKLFISFKDIVCQWYPKDFDCLLMPNKTLLAVIPINSLKKSSGCYFNTFFANTFIYSLYQRIMQFFASVNLLISFDSAWYSNHSRCNQTRDPSFSIIYSFTDTHTHTHTHTSWFRLLNTLWPSNLFDIMIIIKCQSNDMIYGYIV